MCLFLFKMHLVALIFLFVMQHESKTTWNKMLKRLGQILEPHAYVGLRFDMSLIKHILID